MNGYKKGKTRKIDEIVKNTTQTIGSRFALVSKMEVQTWKAYLVVFFVAGFAAALVWGVYNSWYIGSKGATSPTLYTQTDNEVHKTGEAFTTQILLDTASQNIVAVQAIATFDPNTVSVTGTDSSISDFTYEVMKNLDTQAGKIFIAAGKPTPGVNSASAKVASVSLKALKDFNGAGVTLKFLSSSAVDDSAAILDDGKGTNVLAAVLAKFTNPAPPVDTTAPVRSGGSPTGSLASGTTQTTLKLVTNENATCKYDQTAGTAFGSMANSFTSTDGLNHSASLSGLTDGKTYNYYTRCNDAAGNANTDDYLITFSVATAPPPTSGPVISSVSAQTTATAATVKWTTDVPATTLVEYGATTSYGSQTALDTNLLTSHSASISGLTAATTYHYRVKSKDSAGKETVSVDYSFKTKRASSTTNPGKGNKK